MSEINNIKPLAQPGVTGTRTASGRADGAREKVQGGQVPETQADKVSLTDTATQLQALQQKVAELPEVNQARVEAIKAAIEEGRYQVDSQELARKMIDFEGDF